MISAYSPVSFSHSGNSHTRTHTPPTSLAFFFEAVCVNHSLCLTGQYFFFPRLTWQIHLWLHSSVLGSSSLVQSFYVTLWERCWRIKTACDCWYRNVPFAWSGQSSIDFSVRHGFGLSRGISRASQPAPVRVSAEQPRTWTLVLLYACEAPGMIAGT